MHHVEGDTDIDGTQDLGTKFSSNSKANASVASPSLQLSLICHDEPSYVFPGQCDSDAPAANCFQTDHTSLSDTSDNCDEFDDQAQSMTSDHSHFTTEEMPYNDFIDTTMEYGKDQDDKELTNNPRARVLKHLDDVLRDRVNLEIQEFHKSLHSVFDQQLDHVMLLLSISKPDILKGDSQDEELPEGSQDEELPEEMTVTNRGNTRTFAAGEILEASSPKLCEAEQYHHLNYGTNISGQDHEKTKLTMQMMTLASSISHVLRRKEFKT